MNGGRVDGSIPLTPGMDLQIHRRWSVRQAAMAAVPRAAPAVWLCQRLGQSTQALSRTALVLRASGQAGTAVVAALAKDGWQVSAGGRRAREWADGVRGVQVDRDSGTARCITTLVTRALPGRSVRGRG
jgi:hypothetical protein